MERNSVHSYVHPTVYLSFQRDLEASLRGLGTSKRGLRANWRGLKASWKDPRAHLRDLRASQRGLRASKRSLRACQRGLGSARGFWGPATEAWGATAVRDNCRPTRRTWGPPKRVSRPIKGPVGEGMDGWTYRIFSHFTGLCPLLRLHPKNRGKTNGTEINPTPSYLSTKQFTAIRNFWSPLKKNFCANDLSQGTKTNHWLCPNSIPKIVKIS